MTIEEMDAEIARMDANLRRWCDEAIEECMAELDVVRNEHRREFVQQQLEQYRAMRQRHLTAA
jgi:hypothetical protein